MTDHKTAELLLEAARWRLLGLLFERPRPEWSDELSALAAELGDERLREAARAAVVDEGLYLAIFGPGGPVSPREVSYRPMGDPGKILAELRGVYEAFAYAPRSEDPVDHVAVEVGFVGFLKLKLAYAVARNDAEGQRACHKAIDGFVREHLATFVFEQARRLEQTGLPHVADAAAILADACAFARPEKDPLAVITPDAPDPADNFTCALE